MKLTKVDEPNVRALKLSGNGAVYYSRWTDEDGGEYIRIEENVGGYEKLGSFSDHAFRVDDVGSEKPLTGYDTSTGGEKASSDNNMSAFLRAAKADFVARREA